jgi:hypothetical protein
MLYRRVLVGQRESFVNCNRYVLPLGLWRRFSCARNTRQVFLRAAKSFHRHAQIR